jgi:hypothetical protein
MHPSHHVVDAIVDIDLIYLGPHFEHIDKQFLGFGAGETRRIRVRKPTALEIKFIADNESMLEVTVRKLWIIVHGFPIYKILVDYDLKFVPVEIWALDELDELDELAQGADQ